GHVRFADVQEEKDRPAFLFLNFQFCPCDLGIKRKPVARKKELIESFAQDRAGCCLRIEPVNGAAAEGRKSFAAKAIDDVSAFQGNERRAVSGKSTLRHFENFREFRIDKSLRDFGRAWGEADENGSMRGKSEVSWRHRPI
ncbi:MAG: hypothetical protein WBZ54_07405, partial [Methylocella sp.]